VEYVKQGCSSSLLFLVSLPFISGPMDSPPSESLETTQQLWPRCCAPLTARSHETAAQGTCLTPKLLFGRTMCLLNTPSPTGLLNTPPETHQAGGTCPVCQPPTRMVEHIQPKAPQLATGREEEVTYHPAAPSVCSSKEEGNRQNQSCKPSLGQQPLHLLTPSSHTRSWQET